MVVRADARLIATEVTIVVIVVVVVAVAVVIVVVVVVVVVVFVFVVIVGVVIVVVFTPSDGGTDGNHAFFPVFREFSRFFVDLKLETTFPRLKR